MWGKKEVFAPMQHPNGRVVREREHSSSSAASPATSFLNVFRRKSKGPIHLGRSLSSPGFFTSSLPGNKRALHGELSGAQPRRAGSMRASARYCSLLFLITFATCCLSALFLWRPFASSPEEVAPSSEAGLAAGLLTADPFVQHHDRASLIDFMANEWSPLFVRRKALDAETAAYAEIDRLNADKKPKDQHARKYVLYLDESTQDHAVPAATDHIRSGKWIKGKDGRLSPRPGSIPVGTHAEDTADLEADAAPPVVDPQGYVMYLPHSGFHNQRLELENALLISSALNRTLILPPVYMNLGSSLSWAKFPVLLHRLYHIEEMYARRTGEQKAILDWTMMYDLHRGLRSLGLKFIHVEDFLTFNLTSTADHFYFIQDEERYAYKIIDSVQPRKCPSCLVDGVQRDLTLPLLNITAPAFRTRYFDARKNSFAESTSLGDLQTRFPESIVPMDTYSHLLHLDGLKQIKQPILCFGSLFGSSRLHLNVAGNLALAERIRSRIIYSNPTLISVTNSIVEQIDPEHYFVGVHLRAGDGSFKDRLAITITQMQRALQDWLAEEEGSIDLRGADELAAAHVNQKWSAYIATDLSDDELRNVLPTEFTSLFTAVYTLTSFRAALDPLSALAAPSPAPAGVHALLKEVMPSASDLQPDQANQAVNLPPFSPLMTKQNTIDMWLPFVDQMVAARARVVLGTRGSTFSKYLERMNTVYWQEVTRGGGDEWEGNNTVD